MKGPEHKPGGLPNVPNTSQKILGQTERHGKTITQHVIKFKLNDSLYKGFC